MKLTAEFITHRYYTVGTDFLSRMLPGAKLPAIQIDAGISMEGDNIKNATTMVMVTSEPRLHSFVLQFFIGSIEKSILNTYETQYKDDSELVMSLYVDYIITHELAHVYLATIAAGEDGTDVKRYADLKADAILSAKEEALADDISCIYLSARDFGREYVECLNILKEELVYNHRALANKLTTRDRFDFADIKNNNKSKKLNKKRRKVISIIKDKFIERQSTLVKSENGYLMTGDGKVVLEPKDPF